MNDAKATQTQTALHPGHFVRAKLIEPEGLSVKDAAAALGVHRVALSRLLNEQAALSPEMAARLEKAFGFDMVHLMRMQSEYDIREAKLRFRKITVPGHVAVDIIRGLDGAALQKEHAKRNKRKSGQRG